MADWLAAYPASAEAEDDFEHAILERHGARPVGVSAAHRGALRYGEPAFVPRRLADGDVLESAGRALRVLHRPGHSPLDTVLHDEERGLLIGGDHLLALAVHADHGAPVADDARNGRPRAFHDYLASLRATDALPLEAVLPGHGDVVEDPRATIAKRLDRYARITGQTAAAVRPDPRSAAAIATEIKGPLPENVAFFVLCEVLGHLDELIDAGAVVEHADAGRRRGSRPHDRRRRHRRLARARAGDRAGLRPRRRPGRARRAVRARRRRRGGPRAGGEPVVVAADVTDPDALRRSRRSAPDVVVAAAGIPGPTAPLWEISPADWDETRAREPHRRLPDLPRVPARDGRARQRAASS